MTAHEAYKLSRAKADEIDEKEADALHRQIKRDIKEAADSGRFFLTLQTHHPGKVVLDRVIGWLGGDGYVVDTDSRSETTLSIGVTWAHACIDPNTTEQDPYQEVAAP